MKDPQTALEERFKYRNSLASQIQVLVDKLSDKLGEMTEHDIQTYHMLQGPDCLYGDSPVGKPFTYEYLKQYMIKKDLDFVGYFLDGKINIKDFTERMKDATAWMARFTKPIQQKKSGIDAILGGQ